MSERHYTTREAVEHFMALCPAGDTTILAAYVMSRIIKEHIGDDQCKPFIQNFLNNAGLFSPSTRDDAKSIELTCKAWPAIWAIADIDLQIVNNQFVALARKYGETAGIKMPSLISLLR